MQGAYFQSHTRSANQRVQISQGLQIDIPNHHTFYTRSTAYKKKGAPDQRSTHLLLLLACASPRTKSKGLQRYVLQIYYFINQVFKSFCSSTCIIIDVLVLP
jgi:rRNA pseudouridine-1189 N-methylase Emg1 (Nep1/Mra1 family)